MIFNERLPEDWKDVLRPEMDVSTLNALARFLEEERASGSTVYPIEEHIFNAFQKTPYRSVKVVIMGQDPYHGPGQAHGLSFSVQKGVKIPPSLVNIYKEMHDDVGVTIPDHGNLEYLAEQGVLMLNATLTVRHKEPRSHYGKGWEHFTDGVIRALAKRKEPLIFVLWGKSANEKCASVMNTHHTVLCSPHPSPYSAHSGFFGCKHFSKINGILDQPINWQAPLTASLES